MIKRSRPRHFTRGRNNNNHTNKHHNNGARLRQAQQNYEKYQNLAREALSSGDRVLAENHFQHADHFYRVVQDLTPVQECDVLEETQEIDGIEETTSSQEEHLQEITHTADAADFSESPQAVIIEPVVRKKRKAEQPKEASVA